MKKEYLKPLLKHINAAVSFIVYVESQSRFLPTLLIESNYGVIEACFPPARPIPE